MHSNTADLLIRANIPVPNFVNTQTFDVWMLWGCGIAAALSFVLFVSSYFLARKSVLIQPIAVKVFPHDARVVSDPFFLNAAKEPNNVLFGLKLKVINQSDKPVCVRHWSFYVKPSVFYKVKLVCKFYGHNSGPVFGFPATIKEFIGKKTEPYLDPYGFTDGTVALEIPANTRHAGVAEAVDKVGSSVNLFVECKIGGTITVRRKIKVTRQR